MKKSALKAAAQALGLDVSSAGVGFGWGFAYTGYEIIGSALAAGLFRVVRPDDFVDGAGAELSSTYEYELGTKCVSEFIGTYVLVLTVGLNVLGGSPAGAWSIAASLMCMIYALGDVSGANFNPAVTLAILCSKMTDMTPKKAGLYMVAQIVGAIVAAFTYSLIYSGHTFALGPQPGYKWGQVAVAEIIFTFVLCFVVLSVAISEKTAAPEFFGLAIGSCVTVGGFAIGGISGGSLNPAVSVGIATADTFNGGNIANCLVYALFEVIGALMAAGVFEMTHAVDLDQSLPVSKKAAAEERF